MSGFDFGFDFAKPGYVPPVREPDVGQYPKKTYTGFDFAKPGYVPPVREPYVDPHPQNPYYPGFDFARSDKAFFERSRAPPPFVPQSAPPPLFLSQLLRRFLNQLPHKKRT